MFTLKLCQQFCAHLLPNNIGKKLGDGADGEVFELTDDQHKVIKISVVYDSFSRAKNINKILFNFINHPLSAYARVFTYKHIGNFKRKIYGGIEQDLVLYYYLMEKLNKISEDERKVFHTILSHEDNNIIKNYAPPKLKKILYGLSRALDFDEKRVIFFYDAIKSAPIIHNDLHPRNIMKDDAGNFKLIDFDRCILKLENSNDN